MEKSELLRALGASLCAAELIRLNLEKLIDEESLAGNPSDYAGSTFIGHSLRIAQTLLAKAEELERLQDPTQTEPPRPRSYDPATTSKTHLTNRNTETSATHLGRARSSY